MLCVLSSVMVGVVEFCLGFCLFEWGRSFQALYVGKPETTPNSPTIPVKAESCLNSRRKKTKVMCGREEGGGEKYVN